MGQDVEGMGCGERIICLCLTVCFGVAVFSTVAVYFSFQGLIIEDKFISFSGTNNMIVIYVDNDQVGIIYLTAIVYSPTSAELKSGLEEEAVMCTSLRAEKVVMQMQMVMVILSCQLNLWINDLDIEDNADC